MHNFTAVLDACVLVRASLRDFLMHLTLTGLFRAKWTDHIHAEWMAAVLKTSKNPLVTPEKLEHTRSLMDAHCLDAKIHGYEPLIPSLTLPDPEDRHVLAAAIRCDADVIVTSNLKDFPKSELEKWGIEAQSPDEFIVHLFDLSAAQVLEAAARHRKALKNPSRTASEHLEVLSAQGLITTVSLMKPYESVL